MNAHQRLVHRVSEEQDDVLATLQLVRGDAQLEDRLFEQLVDLLVEGMFLDLRLAFLAGELERDPYLAELDLLGGRCRAAGLLPLTGQDA